MKLLASTLLTVTTLYLFAQTNPPMPAHRSGLPPPPTIVPTLRKWPNSTMMLNLPIHKRAEMYSISAMSMEELLERVRTNKFNLYLIEVVDNPEMRLKQVTVTAEEEQILQSFRQGQPQHP